MKKYTFYKITSPSGGIYIGKTCDYSKRMYKHRNEYLVKGKRNYTPIELSFQLHGFSNHEVVVLNKCFCNDAFSDYLEQEYIRVYQSFVGWNDNGLNRNTGGSKNISQSIRKKVKRNLTPEWFKKRSELSVQMMKSPERRAKSSEVIKKLIRDGVLNLSENGKKNAVIYLDKSTGKECTVSDICIIENKKTSGVNYIIKKYGHYKNRYFKK